MTTPPPLTSPPPAQPQPSKHSSPLAINLDPTKLLFSTPPTSPQTLFDIVEDLPPTTTNPPPPRPLFDSIKSLANEPPPIPAIEPPLPPILTMEPLQKDDSECRFHCVTLAGSIQAREPYRIGLQDKLVPLSYTGRFNTIITSLKALDESFSSRNHVNKFLRALPTKWRLKKDSKDSKVKKEKYKSLALKARKVSSDKEEPCSGSNEEYAMAVRDFKKFFRRKGKFIRQPHDDKKSLRKVKEEKKGKEDRRCFKFGYPNHFISDCPKHSFNDQKTFVRGCWSESDEEDESKKDEICLMALDNNENYSKYGVLGED
ncbi:hypothetical protein Tco_0759608 [Tanacetum coccineum]